MNIGFERALPTDGILQFDEPSHTYTLNGIRLLSVTQTIVAAGRIDTRWFTPEAAERGRAVHEAVFLDIHDDLDRDDLHEIIKPFCMAWFLFRRQTNFKAIKSLCEKKQYHPVWYYAGTPDLLGFLNGKVVLIDVKTGDSPTAKYQTAAYSEFPAIKKLNPLRFDLRLYNNGSYKLNQHNGGANDFAVFLNDLRMVRGQL